jgi:hypothetical protein
MAISSSVNKLFAFKGSVQSKDTGVCMDRFAMAAERAGAFNCLAACLLSWRNMAEILCRGLRNAQ